MFGTGVSGIHATCRFSFCFFPTGEKEENGEMNREDKELNPKMRPIWAWLQGFI